MKFYRGQKVICRAESNEWNPILNDFDEALRIALGMVSVPIKNKIYTVTNPLELWHDGKAYISVKGFKGKPLDENAFVPYYEKGEMVKEEFEFALN